MRVVRSTAVIRKSSCRGVGGVGVLRTIRPLSASLKMCCTMSAKSTIIRVCSVRRYVGCPVNTTVKI